MAAACFGAVRILRHGLTTVPYNVVPISCLRPSMRHFLQCSNALSSTSRVQKHARPILQTIQVPLSMRLVRLIPQRLQQSKNLLKNRRNFAIAGNGGKKNPVNNTSYGKAYEDSEEFKKLSLFKRVWYLVKRYWYVAVPVMIGINLVCGSIFYTIAMFTDSEALLNRSINWLEANVPLPDSYITGLRKAAKHGHWAFVYFCFKLTWIPRDVGAIVLTMFVVRALRRRGWIRGIPPARVMKDMIRDGSAGLRLRYQRYRTLQRKRVGQKRG